VIGNVLSVRILTGLEGRNVIGVKSQKNVGLLSALKSIVKITIIIAITVITIKITMNRTRRVRYLVLMIGRAPSVETLTSTLEILAIVARKKGRQSRKVISQE